jgi:hypothetical protein
MPSSVTGVPLAVSSSMGENSMATVASGAITPLWPSTADCALLTSEAEPGPV